MTSNPPPPPPPGGPSTPPAPTDGAPPPPSAHRPPPPPGFPAAGAPAAWPAAPMAPSGFGTDLGTVPNVEAEEGNLALAIVGGVAGAFVAGLAWWGVVATTRFQATFVAIGVGAIVAYAVLLCCPRRNRVPLQAIAGVCTLASLAVSEYFIQRTLFIKEYGDRFDGFEVPLWDGFGYARDVVQESLKEDPLTGLFWLAAVVAAVVMAGNRDIGASRR